MKEVSCRALDGFFRELARSKRPPTALIEGVSYSLGHLRDRNEHIDWASFLRFMENAGRIWSPEELETIGAAFLRAPFMRFVRIIARLLFSVRDLYNWVNAEGGNQLFTCIRGVTEAINPREIVFELQMREGYSPCPEFAIVTRGALKSLPRLIGEREAEVNVVQLPNRTRFEIAHPVGGGVLRRIWRLLTSPITVVAAGRELRDAHQALQVRYRELESARFTLALQATQLNTAYSVSAVVHSELDLDRTGAAVARALVEVAGFRGARIVLDAETERARIQRVVDAQVPEGDEPDFALPLSSHGRVLGDLLLWSAPGADPRERRKLLHFLVPTLSMTLGDALTFTALSDYRGNLEQMVAERTTQLVTARDSLAETVERLEEARQARDRLFANLNHEIRTPLSLIQLVAGELRRRQGLGHDEGALEQLDAVDLNVRKLLRLVDSLLLLAAGQEGKLELQMAPFDVAALLRSLMASWSPAAKTAGIALRYDGPEQLEMDGDEVACERIVTNLLSNAIKFTPQGGSVLVELTEPSPDQVQLAVRDTGVGLDEEFKKRIFGRFEQGRAALRPGARGSGIGLSLVRELAEAHGGAVEAQSPPGGGTIFRVTLPQRVAAARQRETTPRLLPPSTPDEFGLTVGHLSAAEVLAPAGSSRATLIIAEDDPSLREALGKLLSREYRVLMATDGVAALDLAQRHPPDLLVSDVGMPGMDGLELTRRFRALPGCRLAPVLLLTAYGKLRDRMEGFEAGAIDYVTKPFEPEELRARIRSQLDRRALWLRLHETEKMASLGTLSAGLAHEIRNPANAIVNAVSPLREQLPAELVRPGSDAGELLGVLEECATQIALLSRQLLGFHRPGMVAREEVQLSQVIHRALSLIRHELGDAEVKIELGYDGAIWCAVPLLAQVLANLMENAAHAAGPKGWIRLRSRLSEERLVLELSDSGPGVRPALRERIFEPFFTTKPVGKGTGLGLAMARDIVARHDGVLDVRDDGGGSMFHLELPLRPARTEAPQRREAIA